MKKYLNNSHRMVCVEFQTFSQFLRRGDFITSNEEPKTIPVGVIVSDVEPAKTTRKKKESK